MSNFNDFKELVDAIGPLGAAVVIMGLIYLRAPKAVVHERSSQEDTILLRIAELDKKVEKIGVHVEVIQQAVMDRH